MAFSMSYGAAPPAAVTKTAAAPAPKPAAPTRARRRISPQAQAEALFSAAMAKPAETDATPESDDHKG